jgi:hypothetical protein
MQRARRTPQATNPRTRGWSHPAFSLVVIAVLFVLFGLKHFERRALAVFLAAGVALAAVAWSTSRTCGFESCTSSKSWTVPTPI